MKIELDNILEIDEILQKKDKRIMIEVDKKGNIEYCSKPFDKIVDVPKKELKNKKYNINDFLKFNPEKILKEIEKYKLDNKEYQHGLLINNINSSKIYITGVHIKSLYEDGIQIGFIYSIFTISKEDKQRYLSELIKG